MTQSPRLKKLITSLGPNHVDAYLVTKDVNILYLTGFPACESWLLVTPRESFYITDFRYMLEARKGLKGITLVQHTDSIYKTVFDLAKKRNVRRLGFDENHLTVSQYHKLVKSYSRGVQLKPANGLVECLRQIKDQTEIKKTKQALKIHAQALKNIKKYIKPNISEQEIFERLEHFVKSQQVGFSFSPIVASGPNSCYPHAKVTSRKIRQDDVVLLDMGISFSGYKSDLTRMYLLGKIPQLISDVICDVRTAQKEAILKIRDGVSVAEADLAARNSLEKNKLAKYFGHALGHGVGLDIHENPRLSCKMQMTLL